jgi:hypothetical protein
MLYKQPELARITTHEKIANAEPIMLTLIWYAHQNVGRATLRCRIRPRPAQAGTLPGSGPISL